MDNLHWSNLANQCSEISHLLIIFELTNMEPECRHIKKAHSELLGVFLDGQDVFRLITGIFWIFESASGYHIADFSFYTAFLLVFGVPVTCSHSSFKFFWGLGLFHNCYFVTIVYHC